jgi:hypothetical protein
MNMREVLTKIVKKAVLKPVPVGDIVTIQEGTQIRFSLWYVLSFIVILFASAYGLLNAEQKETKQTVILNSSRLSRLEEQNTYIIKSLDKLVIGQDAIDDKLTSHMINNGYKKAIREKVDK